MRGFISLAARQRLQQFAWANRHAPTFTEAKLWSALSGSKLGVPFRRQAVVGPYIVDFLAPRVRLVVEVDGGYHERCRKRDARRDARLRELGYRVVRIEVRVVETNVAMAVARIRLALGG